LLQRLEAACDRAIKFNCITYDAIKRILKGGLEYEAINDNESFDLQLIASCLNINHQTIYKSEFQR